MRRALRQTASLVLVLLFGTSLAANAFGWHGCPHHGRASAPAPESHRPAPSPSVPEVASPGASGADSGPAAGVCTCVGSCHGSSAVPLSPSTGLAAPLADFVRTRFAGAPDHRPRRIRPAYFLPFPHGPPALG